MTGLYGIFNHGFLDTLDTKILFLYIYPQNTHTKFF